MPGMVILIKSPGDKAKPVFFLMAIFSMGMLLKRFSNGMFWIALLGIILSSIVSFWIELLGTMLSFWIELLGIILSSIELVWFDVSGTMILFSKLLLLNSWLSDSFSGSEKVGIEAIALFGKNILI